MLTVVSTHGKAHKSSGMWRIQVTLSDDSKVFIYTQRRSVLRTRLKERGLTVEQIEACVPRN